MDLQDLAYALNQVVHNFGAVAVTAGAACAHRVPPAAEARGQRSLAWLVLCGWAAQGASGATFAAISFATFGRLPEIHGVAVAALVVKAACALAGLAIGTLVLARGSQWNAPQQQHAWNALLALAATALCAAAFLRWFS